MWRNPRNPEGSLPRCTTFVTTGCIFCHLPGDRSSGTLELSYYKAVKCVKLWQGFVLLLVYSWLGYFPAKALGIPWDVRSRVFVGLLTLVLAAVLLAPLKPAGLRALFRVRRPLLPWTAALLAGMLLFSQLSVLLAMLFASEADAKSLTDGTLPLQVLAIAVLGPLCEELIYRGGLTQGLCARIPWKEGIVLSAVAFMIGHPWFQIPQTLLIGLVLGYLCWYTGSLGYGILIHILFNGLLFFYPSSAALLEWNRAAAILLSLGIVAAGLALTLWALRGFTRCTDRLQVTEAAL